MDPFLADFLSKGAIEALKEAIKAIFSGIAAGRQKKLTKTEEKKIAEIAERMVHTATMEEILQFDPKYEKVAGGGESGEYAVRSTGTKHREAKKGRFGPIIAVKKRAAGKLPPGKLTKRMKRRLAGKRVAKKIARKR